MIELPLVRDSHAPLNILCLGAHSDDLEIGCGGTLLRLTRLYPSLSVRWVVFSASTDARRAEALAGGARFLAHAGAKKITVGPFREAFFPSAWEQIKEYVEQLRTDSEPDLVFTHYRFDLHQDHKLVSELTWNTFRRALVLEYEIPKWDGDLGTPSCYVRLADDIVEEKIRAIRETFPSQQARHWFTDDTFRALMRLRGVECNARYAEAFYARKLTLG
jgi:LmbE family N-acetylglucosaminyl deacetylase